MTFVGFVKSDFDTFHIKGLEERMEAIQDRIQPKFQIIGDILTDDLAAILGNEMFLHIAKHARRTVNPPQDTWLAICNNKRGYKQHPHFQIGLFDDHLFIWLAFIYELPGKTEIAKTFLKNTKMIKDTIPNDYVVSLDHMKKGAVSIEQLNLTKALERFRDVKKSEFLIGRHIAINDPILQNGEKLIQLAKETFDTLIPIYQLAYSS
ncbi:YktB family protein [Bacillus sp. FSL K6-3431]|uniref:YktB family protein n=1 Tax=Bacillus sp. FSL K6-3431 TaxID=2921500 RepID=UPI0030F699A6